MGEKGKMEGLSFGFGTWLFGRGGVDFELHSVLGMRCGMI